MVSEWLRPVDLCTPLIRLCTLVILLYDNGGGGGGPQIRGPLSLCSKKKYYSILFDDLDAYLYSKVHGSRIGLTKIKQGLYYLPGMIQRLCGRWLEGGLGSQPRQPPRSLLWDSITEWVTYPFISSKKCIHMCLRILN